MFGQVKMRTAMWWKERPIGNRLLMIGRDILGKLTHHVLPLRMLNLKLVVAHSGKNHYAPTGASQFSLLPRQHDTMVTSSHTYALCQAKIQRPVRHRILGIQEERSISLPRMQ